MEKQEIQPDPSVIEEKLEEITDPGQETPPSNVLATDESPKPTKVDDGDDWVYVTGFALIAVMSTVTLSVFIIMLDMSIIVTAIPQITSDFHSLVDVGWYGASYLVANCALQPLTGKFFSRFNSKYTFLSFVAVFELGSLLCGVATSSKMLIVGRAVAGLGSSGLINGALTIIAACVPLERRAANLGIVLGIAQLGILFGPLIGGSLTQYTTWRWCFFINLPIGAVVAIILLLIRIPDRTAKNQVNATFRSTLQSFDLFGFVLFAPTATMFLLALEWGGTTYPWNSATIIGLFCGAGGTLCLFLAWEHKRGDTAMIPFPMVGQRIVWASCLSTIFFAANLMITSYYLPIYFQAIRGVSPTLSGVYMLPGILSQMLFAVISGILVDRLGYYLPWSVGCGVLAAIGSGLISTYTPWSTTGTWIGYQIIGGVGRGCGLQMPIVAIQNTLKPDQIPIGMSLVAFSQTFGGAVFLSFAETTFTNGLFNALPTFAPGVNPGTVISAGATGFRSVVPQMSVDGVILSYDKAFSHVFYLAAGASVAQFMCSCGMGWKSVKKAKTVAAEA